MEGFQVLQVLQVLLLLRQYVDSTWPKIRVVKYRDKIILKRQKNNNVQV